jgi:hypothetical protein
MKRGIIKKDNGQKVIIKRKISKEIFEWENLS